MVLGRVVGGGAVLFRVWCSCWDKHFSVPVSVSILSALSGKGAVTELWSDL